MTGAVKVIVPSLFCVIDFIRIIRGVGNEDTTPYDNGIFIIQLEKLEK
jgi:hypothetical protein